MEFIQNGDGQSTYEQKTCQTQIYQEGEEDDLD